MKIEVYTKTYCSHCVMAKRYLANQSLDFVEYVVEQDISVDDVKEKFPTAKTVPIILVDDVYIGGYSDLIAYLAEAA